MIQLHLRQSASQFHIACASYSLNNLLCIELTKIFYLSKKDFGG
uniref:Uncharacterized protein n=1 Tax=Anguilla anguilla TaxID=7936 RepID=A0A0E9WC74_ANGAN